jgi:hypothetical protein
MMPDADRTVHPPARGPRRTPGTRWRSHRARSGACGTIGSVTTFYDLDAANARLPDLRDLLADLRDQRAELIRLRDRATEDDVDEEERRRLRLRMQGIIDQMQAAVVRIDAWDITLRDIESGLIDFPALVNGRQVCLCWRLGEEEVAWWHELSSGFAGRRELADLA